MGVCLRGKMTDAGILPAPAIADVPAPAEVAVAAPTSEPAIAEPALDVTPAPEVPDDLIAATFGLQDEGVPGRRGLALRHAS